MDSEKYSLLGKQLCVEKAMNKNLRTNGTAINNNNTNKRTFVDSTFMMPASSLSPHSPSTSSSSTSSAKLISNLNTSSSSSSSSSHNNDSNGMLLFNDLNLKLNMITQVLKNNDLVLNCVQFVNLIDLYFEDDLNNNVTNEDTSKKSDSVNFLFDLKQDNSAGNELKLVTDSSTMTTTCFPCIVCSSRFSFEQTFHLHLERRSILIRFYCVKCQAFKSFYNKCKLLYHVYSHKMFLFESIYKSIKIESITIERLNLSKERNIDFSACINFNFNADIDELIANNQSMTDLSESLFSSRTTRIQQNDNENIKMFLRRLVSNRFLLFRCSICDALFFDLKELKLHYYKSQQHELEHLNATSTNTNNGAANNHQINRRYIYKNLKQKYSNSFNKNIFNFVNENLSNFHNKESNITSDKINLFVNVLNELSLKKLQFSTRCSTLANMNLISSNYQFYSPANPSIIYINSKHSRQLICPECGISFDSKTQFEKFRLHLVYECLFTSKYDCGQIKCSATNCSYLAESVNDFVAHWSKTHIKNEHQCDLCDKKGLQFIFENENPTINHGTTDLSVRNSQLFKSMLTNDEENDADCTSNTDNNVFNEPILSSGTISEINKHFFEKHRNLQVALKLVYRCSCKTSTNLNENSEKLNDVDMTDNNPDCVHTTWKGCHKHIINLIARTLASLNCLMCNKLVPNNEYQTHLKSVHNLEKISICPICGVLKDENSLQNHIFKMHSQLNLNDHPTSSFFNLVTTLNKQLTSNQLLSLNSGNMHNLLQSSQYLLPENFFIYQCLNCRLFFASNCKFSHNCWTYTEISKSGGKDPKQQSTNNNYFSPIYLKFNVNKALFSKSNQIINKKLTDEPKLNNKNAPNDLGVNSSSKKLKISEYEPQNGVTTSQDVNEKKPSS